MSRGALAAHTHTHIIPRRRSLVPRRPNGGGRLIERCSTVGKREQDHTNDQLSSAHLSLFSLGKEISHWLRYERDNLSKTERERSWRQRERDKNGSSFSPAGPNVRDIGGSGCGPSLSCLSFPAGLFSFNGRLALIRSRVAQTRRPPDPAWSGRADLSLSGDSLAAVKKRGLGGVPEIVLGGKARRWEASEPARWQPVVPISEDSQGFAARVAAGSPHPRVTGASETDRSSSSLTSRQVAASASNRRRRPLTPRPLSLSSSTLPHV